MNPYPRILPVGEAAFTVEFGERMDETLNRQVHALDASLKDRPFPGLVEAVPTYRSLLVIYNPIATNEADVRAALTRALEGLAISRFPEGRLIEIPVRYGGETGPDLEDVAAQCGLKPADIIQLHTQPIYRVAMLGFSPGFAYLLGLTLNSEIPRLTTPRDRVAPGSVGIAGSQTGVYTLSTPGGWRIIGQTPMPLFIPDQEDPFALHAGDRVRFIAMA